MAANRTPFFLFTGPLLATLIATFLPWIERTADAAECDRGSETLDTMFESHPDGLAGADYQRATRLPDGRLLWVFQDAFVDLPSGGTRLVHNVGLVEQGACFELLHRGTAEQPEPWIGADDTTRFAHWYWPLGATLPGDGTIRLFVAEFREYGDHYLAHATPIATWVATIDIETLTPRSLDPAPDSSAALYGWSVASDGDSTYLYGHCYRQFGFGWLGHDACAGAVRVARTNRTLTAPLRYWDGENWVADPVAAINIAPTAAFDGTPRTVNPMQVARVGSQWIAVTKEGDWWGSRIYLDHAPGPAGPWTTTAILYGRAPDADHDTYFASIIPSDNDVVIGLSNNRWDGAPCDCYHPTFRTVPLTAWSASTVASGSGVRGQ